MTHCELVEIARLWLSRKKKCSLITTEIASEASEQPDALGWNGCHSTLVECKVSASDFKADAKKHFRQFPELGMGCERYFLIPKGLITLPEIPPPWGLLEYDGKRVLITRKSEQHKANARGEIRILLSLLRRIGSAAPVGVSIKCYTMATGNRCTLTISDDESAPNSHSADDSPQSSKGG